MSSQPTALQRHTLDAFTVLSLLRPGWAGLLVFSVGLEERGAALLLAANIAGAVSLAVDDDPTHLRDVIRSGAADFVVNTLDEALRAIKNEVRRQTPLAVALQANPSAVLHEAIERGLAPALFARFAGLGSDGHVKRAIAYFGSLGTTLVDFRSNAPVPSAGDLTLSARAVLTPHLSGQRWRRVLYSASTVGELRSFDLAVLEQLPKEDMLRRRWMEGVQYIFARQRPPHRYLWVTSAELDSLATKGFSMSIEDIA